jgi:hypothetical protein
MLKNLTPGQSVTVASAKSFIITIKRDYLISSIKEEFYNKINGEQEFNNLRLVEMLGECLVNYFDRIDKECSM